MSETTDALERIAKRQSNEAQRHTSAAFLFRVARQEANWALPRARREAAAVEAAKSLARYIIENRDFGADMARFDDPPTSIVLGLRDALNALSEAEDGS